MKHATKILSLLLALMMVFSLSLTAFATDLDPSEPTPTETSEPTTPTDPNMRTVDNQTDHSYDAYQIFSGTQDAGNSMLGDVQWGSGINSDAFLTALKADSRLNVTKQDAEGNETTANIFADCTSAAEVADVLAKYKDGDTQARVFASIADLHLTGTKVEIPAGSNTVKLAAGFYLLVDTTDVDGKTDARNQALLQVTNDGDIQIKKKYDVPSVNKDIVTVNETRVEADDASIGDNIKFILEGTLPNNFDEYTEYFYQFNDTLCAALQYNNDVKVSIVPKQERAKADPIVVTNDFVITDQAEAGDTGRTILTVKNENLKTLEEKYDVTLDNTYQIVVEYTAKLLPNAVIGSEGNPNVVNLEFSNNPNHDGKGKHGKTPDDTVLVFTYLLDNTKTDATNNNKLKDAQFILTNAAGQLAKVVDGKLNSWVTDDATTKDEDGNYLAEYLLVSDESGKFNVAGLDSGTYYLTETKAPSGYNKLEGPIEITISATLETGENTPGLSALTIRVGTAAAVNGDPTTGTVVNVVKNNSGSVLPETGGIGTTIFYVVGSILLVGAAVLLITKKRVNAAR